MDKEKKRGKHSAPSAKKTKSKNKNFFKNLYAGFCAMSKGKKALIISLVSVILIVAIIIGVILAVIGDLTRDYNHQEIDDPEIEQIKPIDDQIMNIALFGIDSREQDFTGLSDSIMVLSINKKTGDIKLISIMRDSFVNLPELNGKTYKPNKINSAYSRGGASYAIKTLNQNFGLDIKEYATVNFYGMAEIIDAVGGIEIDVLKREINATRGINACIMEQALHLGIDDPPYVEEPGLQVLSGIQAVAWARIRAVSTEQGTANDYGRTDRQRVVMEKLLNKALAMDVSEYPDLIKAILPHTQTSLSLGEIVKLATEVLGKQVKFEQTRVPQEEYVMPISGVSYAGSVVYYDLAFASKIIHAVIYDGVTQEEFVQQNGIEKNKWYNGGTSTGSSSKNESSKPSSSTSGSSSQSTTSTGNSSAVSPSSQVSSSQSSENVSSEESSSVVQETPEEDISSEVVSSEEASSNQESTPEEETPSQPAEE